MYLSTRRFSRGPKLSYEAEEGRGIVIKNYQILGRSLRSLRGATFAVYMTIPRFLRLAQRRRTTQWRTYVWLMSSTKDNGHMSGVMSSLNLRSLGIRKGETCIQNCEAGFGHRFQVCDKSTHCLHLVGMSGDQRG